MPSAREFTVHCLPSDNPEVRFPDALKIARYKNDQENAHLNHGLAMFQISPMQKGPATFTLTFPSKKCWASFVAAHWLTCKWKVGSSKRLKSTHAILTAKEFQLFIIDLLNSFKDHYGQAVVMPEAFVTKEELENFYTAATLFCLAIKRFFDSQQHPHSTARALVVDCLQVIDEEWDEYWHTKSVDFEVPRTADDVNEEDLLTYLLDKLAILDLTQHLRVPSF